LNAVGAMQDFATLAADYPEPQSELSRQLMVVAQMIMGKAGIRGYATVTGGFDTHSTQLPAQDSLYGQMSPALAAFYQATQELNVGNAVTTFTLSDFSRTFKPDSNSGSDHAWGNHQLIVGGAVQGHTLYGTYPNMTPGGPEICGSATVATHIPQQVHLLLRHSGGLGILRGITTS